MLLATAIEQAQKLLNSTKKRPPTNSETEAIKRLIEHAQVAIATKVDSAKSGT